jgi:hypothetical protein
MDVDDDMEAAAALLKQALQLMSTFPPERPLK